MMTILRTPEERFVNLPGYNYAPHYVDINGMRVHYLDEGQGDTILCLHGEPTWSYLYRKMIPILSTRQRTLCMDFIGFGRSDKYSQEGDYSFSMHLKTLRGFIEALSLEQITLVVQDWGGLTGLTAASQMPERFARLVIMNTFLPTGDEPASEAFMQWRQAARRFGKRMPIGRIIRSGMADADKVPKGVMRAYEAPFPDNTYKAGAAVWPLLVPIRPDDPGAAEMRGARAVFSEWEKPVQTIFSDSDPITSRADILFRRLMPVAREQPRITIENAGHFLQEEKGPQIATHIQEFIDRTPIG